MVRRRRTPEVVHIVVGIDPGTTCGFAVIAVEGGEMYLDDWGTWDLSRRLYEGGGMQMVRLRNYLQRTFEEVHGQGELHLALEENRFGSDRGATTNGMIVGCVMEECDRWGIPYVGVPPSRTRKWAVGDGGADKEVVKAELEQMFGVRFKVEDEADAVAVAVAHARMMGWWDWDEKA